MALPMMMKCPSGCRASLQFAIVYSSGVACTTMPRCSHVPSPSVAEEYRCMSIPLAGLSGSVPTQYQVPSTFVSCPPWPALISAPAVSYHRWSLMIVEWVGAAVGDTVRTSVVVGDGLGAGVGDGVGSVVVGNGVGAGVGAGVGLVVVGDGMGDGVGVGVGSVVVGDGVGNGVGLVVVGDGMGD